MTRITLKSSINNEFRLGLESDPILAPRRGDNADIRRREMSALRIAEMERMSAIMRNAEIRASISVEADHSKIPLQLAMFGNPTPLYNDVVPRPIVSLNYRTLDLRPNGRFLFQEKNFRELVEDRERARTLTLSKNFNAPRKPLYGRDYKAKNFSAAGRHAILEAGALLDAHFEKSEIFEVTLTLPGDTPEAIHLLANYSGWIVNRLNQIIRRQPDHAEIHSFYVWEFQKRGALHMHWAIARKGSEKAFQLAEAIKNCWYSCLIQLGMENFIDMFRNRAGYSWESRPEKWRWSIQPMKKSLARYYSKYVSKSAANLKRFERYKHRQIWYPSRWWGMKRSTNREIKKWRIKLCVSSIEFPKAQLLREKLREVFGSIVNSSLSYSFDYLIPGNTESAPIASGEVEIFFSPPAQWKIWHSGLRILQAMATIQNANAIGAGILGNLSECAYADMMSALEVLPLFSADIIADMAQWLDLGISALEFRSLFWAIALELALAKNAPLSMISD